MLNDVIHLNHLKWQNRGWIERKVDIWVTLWALGYNWLFFTTFDFTFILHLKDMLPYNFFDWLMWLVDLLFCFFFKFYSKVKISCTKHASKMRTIYRKSTVQFIDHNPEYLANQHNLKTGAVRRLKSALSTRVEMETQKGIIILNSWHHLNVQAHPSTSRGSNTTFATLNKHQAWIVMLLVFGSCSWMSLNSDANNRAFLLTGRGGT